MFGGDWKLRSLLMATALMAGLATSGPADATGGSAARATGSHASGNLLHGDAATFDTTNGGWSSTTATDVVSHSTTHRGDGALAITPRIQTTSAPARVMSRPLTAQAGAVYTARFWMNGSSVHSPVRAVLIFTSGTGQVIATIGGATANPSGSWARIPGVTAMAPRKTKTVQAVIAITKPLITYTLYVDDASLVRLPAPRLPSFDQLKVHGNQIVDGRGRNVILKGINRAGLEVGATHALTPNDAAAMARWGVSLVRVPLSPQFWLAKGCSYDPGYRARVDKVVRLLTSRHIVALLDLHTVTPCGGASNYPMPSARLAVPFWKQVARDYRHNPLVAFDLWNEPHDITDDVWFNGGTISWGSDTYRAIGMQALYDVVRRAGAVHNLVFVSGNHWSSAPGHHIVKGHDIVYAIHLYTCPNNPPPNCGFSGSAAYDPSHFLNRWNRLSAHHAVMITEFGWPDRASDGRYIANMVSDAHQRRWGWAVWGYNGTVSGKFDVVGQRLREHTYEPSPVGMPALRDLAS